MFGFIAAQLYKGISEVEVFWVILATFGFVFSVFNSFEAWKDVRAVDKAGILNGRRTIAKTARFQDACRAVVHLIFLAIGLASWTLEERPLQDQSWEIFLITILIRWGLILAAGILVAQSIASFHLRKNILAREKHEVQLAQMKDVDRTHISKIEAVEQLENTADELRASMEET